MFFKYGFHPGSCTSYLLKGDYVKAYAHAHPIIKRSDHWNYITHAVEEFPEEMRGNNFDDWAGFEKKQIKRLKMIAFAERLADDQSLITRWIIEIGALNEA